MRRSTEFPKWVDENRHLLEGKQASVLGRLHEVCWDACLRCIPHISSSRAGGSMSFLARGYLE